MAYIGCCSSRKTTDDTLGNSRSTRPFPPFKAASKGAESPICRKKMKFVTRGKTRREMARKPLKHNGNAQYICNNMYVQLIYLVHVHVCIYIYIYIYISRTLWLYTVGPCALAQEKQKHQQIEACAKSQTKRPVSTQPSNRG